MKRKSLLMRIAGVFVLLISFIILASCSKPAGNKDGRTVLEFWTISLKPAYVPFVQDLIGRYEKEHPEVRIQWIDMPISVMMQKLMASIAGDASPDVVNLNSGYAQVMAQNQAIVCMDDAVPVEIKELYFEGLWQAACFEGKNYAIPWYVTTKVLIYNRKIFKEAGLDPDTPPRTWQDVEKAAAIIRKKTGLYGYMPAIKLLEDFQIWGVPVVSDDGRQALFNSPGGVAVLDWFVQMKENDVMPPETLMEGYHGALDRYQGGKLGMLVAGPTLLMKIKSDAPEVYKNTDVAPMPLGPVKLVPASTMNLVVPRTSRHKKEAVDFALFVANDENQLAFCKLVPIVPSTKKAAKDSYFKTGKGEPLQDKAISISIDQLKNSKDLSLGLKDSQRLNQIIKEATEGAFYGRTTSKAALDRAALEWNKILSK